MQGSQAWHLLNEYDQLNRLQQLSKAVSDNGLTGVKIQVIAQTVVTLKGGLQKNDRVLVIDGNVPSAKQAKVKAFQAKAKQILAGVDPKSASVEIECAVGVGANYQLIENVVDVWTKEEKTIEHKAGQVMLIDFWATWCPPCQKPMAHNQEMLEKNGARWGDKVRIIGVSIDQTIEAITKHVKDKKWEKVEHFHRGSSTSSSDYGAKGVPHVVLVDTHGKIVFIGHPATRELEKDIDALLKGEVLKGEGTAPSGGPEGGELEEGYSKQDLGKVYGEMTKFADTYKTLLENPNVKALADNLMRDFVVLVAYSTFDTISQSFVTKYENVNVMVGAKEAIDEVLKEVHQFMNGLGGSFTTVDRVQAM